MSDEQISADLSPQNESRGGMRFVPFLLFVLVSIFLFIGGSAALLYWVFSEFTGIRNIWLVGCGAPVLLVVTILFIVVTLYTRFGRPVEQIVDAIDAIAAGNLTVRVPEDSSPQFSRIIKRFNKMVGELERADQQRRNLTADIAHELRTPLHIIQGNLEGILDGVYEPTPEHLNATLDETQLLTRLVNDLQTLSLAETGQLPLHFTRFRLADLMADLVISFSAQATARGVDLQTNLADPNQELTADYDRLNQILSNIISNALRHTPAGGQIYVQAAPIASKNNDRLQIMIRDTGAGIAPEELPFIFDRFWRGDKSRSERTHTGLGLAIAKQLVHAHGGAIEAQSEIGKGTTFIIELPNNTIE